MSDTKSYPVLRGAGVRFAIRASPCVGVSGTAPHAASSSALAELEEQGSVRALVEFDVLSEYSSSPRTLRSRSEKAAKSLFGSCCSNWAVPDLGQMTLSIASMAIHPPRDPQ